MKIFLLSFYFSVFVFANAFAQPPGEWMWIHGDSIPNSAGSFGIQGVTSPTNKPPASYEACEWTDLDGNFWLFGGGTPVGQLATLWKYEPLTNQWTWMNGPDTGSAPGHYGIQGMPDPANYPQCRNFGAVTWVDLQNNLWLFGGMNGFSYLKSDLWKYNIGTNEWTWIKGDTNSNSSPIYGTLGVPNMNNSPGARCEVASGWTDGNGDLWLFGGQTRSPYPVKNDLWKYNIASNMWTWMKGSSTDNHFGVYGTKTVEASTNLPPARTTYTHWKDAEGNFWIFGGSRRGLDTIYNDLWRYKPSTNNWTWMNGDNIYYSPGAFGVKCLTDGANEPSARFEHRACVTDDNGNFWMYGGTDWATTSHVNKADLWSYCVSSQQWTWEGGNTSAVNPYWGNLNVPSPLNRPGYKMGANAWYARNQFYLFGGGGNSNALWRFTIDSTCGVCSPTKIDEISTDRFVAKIYPNPTTSTLTLETTNPLNKITLYTTDGRVVKSIYNLHSTNYTLDIADLCAGIYVLDCESEKGRERVKVVKY